MATRIWTGETDGDPTTATNWIDDTVPENGDTVIIPAAATVDIDGADQSAIAPDLLIIEEGCSINIGSRANGVTTAWQINPVTVQTWGTGTIYLETDTVTLFAVYQAGTGAAAGRHKLNITGATITAMTILCASTAQDLGIAGNAGDACTVTTLTQTGGDVTIGLDGNVTTLYANGGKTYIHKAIATVYYDGGMVYNYGGSGTLIEGSSGVMYYMSVTTCTAVNLDGDTVMDCTKDLRARTFTNMQMGKGATFLDPNETVTLTNGLDLYRCGLGDVTIDRGKHFTVGFSAI